MQDPADLPVTPQERTARLVWCLAMGARVTSREAAEITGLTQGAALRLLQATARVVPIYDEAGVWRRTPLSDADEGMRAVRGDGFEQKERRG